MEEKDKQKGRFSHLSDFKRNSSGEYEYVGKTYELGSEIKPFKIKLAIALGVLLVFVIACGSIPAKGMTDTFYVMLPLLLEILASILLAYKCVAFIFSAYPVRAYAMGKTVKPIPIIAIISAALSFSRLVSYTVYFLINSASAEAWYFVILTALNIIIIIIEVYIARAFLKSRWSLIEK